MVDVTLGNGSPGTSADAKVLNGGGSAINADLSSVLGGTSGVNATLPGLGNSSLDAATTDVATTVNGVTGDSGLVDNLLSSLLGGTIGAGGGGDGGAGGAGGNGGNGGGSGGSTIIAELGANAGASSAACMADARGVAQLLGVRYSSAQMAGWHRAVGVHVVKVPVCAQIRANVARSAALNPSIGGMQARAGSDPLILASLARVNSSPSRILGVGQSNGDLTVYVY